MGVKAAQVADNVLFSLSEKSFQPLRTRSAEASPVLSSTSTAATSTLRRRPKTMAACLADLSSCWQIGE